jgi:ABC-type Mn2+/Zn2+ transport system ATPase subunit
MMVSARQLIIGRGSFRIGPFDLDLMPGSITVVIGPNGAGKSTLLQTLSGLIAPLGGVLERPDDVAYLPPPGSVALPFNADYVVVMGRAGRRGLSPGFSPGDWKATHEALARVGASEFVSRRFDQLSSGQQNRVMLARTIAQDARLCLFDEPTALLDPRGVAEVSTTLRLLADDGRALVIATHDLDLAKQADQVVSIGARIESGTPSKMLTATRLSALYATPMTDCHTCGHVSTVTTSASPPTSAST